MSDEEYDWLLPPETETHRLERWAFEQAVYEALSRDPAPQVDLPCAQCGKLVTEDFPEQVWSRDPTGERVFIPFCNAMHRDIHFKRGLWASDVDVHVDRPVDLPGLALDDSDTEE